MESSSFIAAGFGSLHRDFETTQLKLLPSMGLAVRLDEPTVTNRKHSKKAVATEQKMQD
jgi:hypothetical protein